MTAGKLGDHYEGFWTVNQLIELCLGRAREICVEEPGAEADGFEFRFVRVDGVIEFHSVKRQRSKGEWKLAALAYPSPKGSGRSILGDFIRNLRDNATASCVFVSSTGANDLREACEIARKCDTAEQFEQFMQSMAPLRGELEKYFVKSRTLANWNEVYGLLQRIRAVLKDSATLKEDVDERLRAYFMRSDLSEIDAGDERRALAEFVLEKLGVPLSADMILDFLRSRGIVRRDLIGQPNVQSKLNDCVDHYVRVVNGDLVNGSSIPRTEAEQAAELLLDPCCPGGVLIAANAGLGKSCVLAQVLSRIRSQIPTYVVRFDMLEVVQSTTALGTALGLNTSPIAALAGIAGPRPCVFVVDQLDAVSELSGRKSTLWDIFEQLRTEAERFPNMKFLVACRSFDLEHDHRLRRLTTKDSGFTQIKLEPLTPAAVESALNQIGIDASSISGRENELLRVPLHLHLFLISYEPGQKPIETRLQLFDRFWSSKEVKVRGRCERDCSWREVIEALVMNMSTRAALTAVDDVVVTWKETVDAMASEHVLTRDGRRIRFFHESFVDYAFARCFVAQGKSLVDFLISTEQSLFYRSLVRQVLTHLRDDDKPTYVHTLHAVMKDERVRYHLKSLVLDWLSSLEAPFEDEWRLIEELSLIPEISDRALWVIRNSTGWFDLLNSLGVVAGWVLSSSEVSRNRALWLIRAPAVREHRSKAIADLLRNWLPDKQLRSTLTSTIVDQDIWRSIEMQTLFLELLPEMIATSDPAARNHHDWWDALRPAVNHSPSFVLTCVNLWVERVIAAWKPEDRHRRVFSHDSRNSNVEAILCELAKSIPAEYSSWALPRIQKVVELTANDYYEGLITDRTWYARAAGDFHGADGAILESAITALEILASEFPSECDRLLDAYSESQYETAIYIVLRTWMSQPERYADRMHSLFCRRPEALTIGYSVWSDGNPTYAVSRNAIEKCVPHWSEAQVAAIENVILGFTPWPDATEEQINSHRHLLFSSITPSRMTPSGRQHWHGLHSLFPDDDVRVPTETASAFVGSPIPSEKTDVFTDEEWLDAMRKFNTDWSEPRRSMRGTAVELSRVLQQKVEVDPVRFANLSTRMDDTIHPLYFSAILMGVCPLNPSPENAAIKPVPPETIKSVIHRLNALPNRPCGKEISHAFSCLDACDLEPGMLDLLEHYAIHDSDPAEDSRMRTAGDGDRYQGDDVYMAGYNSVRGSAAHSIRDLLFDRQELLERFLPTLEQLVIDPQLSVRACAIDALLPLLNFDRDTAVRLFLKAVGGVDTIFGLPPVDQFLYWACRTHYDVLRPVMHQALHSEDAEAVDCAARHICLASFSVEAAEADARTVLNGTVTMRSAAAKVFATNVKALSCRSRCLAVLPTLFQDGCLEVREIASECWHRFDHDDLVREAGLIESYVESASFPSRREFLILQLEETRAPLPAVIIKVAERFLHAMATHSGELPHPAVYESSTVGTLVVRLYSQANDLQLRVKCLDLIDEMMKLRIDVDQSLAEHER